MPVKCPRCQTAVSVEGKVPRDVVCPNCGSTIQLDPSGTAGWLPTDAPKRLGKFELLEQVGVGAFGTVYKARDTELDRTVAIKIPRSDAAPRPHDTDRFLREARSTARLRHPSIVDLYDAGQSDGVCYLVSEYIQGATLAEQLSARRFGFRQTAELIAEIADALDFAHRHGIVHRDVKPSNIMLDLEGRPHLMDFGLAKGTAEDITMTLEGQVLGTPAYMSPEQARGEVGRIDARSDIYSLGVILYELMTGELPFRGQLRMLLAQVIQDEPRPPRRLNDAIPRDLETICQKAMAKEPARRYATARELADDLRRYLKGEPILARPIGRIARWVRWARRNPAVATLMAAIVVVASIGFAGILWQWQAAVEYARDAHHHAQAALASEQDSRQQRDAVHALNQTLEDALYVSDMVTAKAAWDDGNVELTRELLARHVGTESRDRRGFEWYYLDRLSRAERLTIPIPLRDQFDHFVAFSPDGQRVAGPAAGNTIQIWDATNGQPLLTITEPRAPVVHLAFSPDGSQLALASKNGDVIVCDAHTGHRLRTLKGHQREVFTVAFSPDGEWLVSAGSDGLLNLWDATSDQPRRTFRAPGQKIRGVAISPDGTRVVAACWDPPAMIRCWDVADGSEVYRVPNPKGELDFNTNIVTFSPDGKLLASGHWGGTILIRDAVTQQLVNTLRGHTTAVQGLVFSRDGLFLISAGMDAVIRFWDVSSGELVHALRSHTQRVDGIDLERDGSHLVSIGRDGTIKVWQLAISLDARSIPAHSSGVDGISFSPDGQLLASIGSKNDQTIRLWNSRTGQQVRELRWNEPVARWEPYRIATRRVAFAPQQRVLASASSFGTIRLWNPDDGRLVLATSHPTMLLNLAFSPDGSRLAVSGWDPRLRVLDSVSGKVVQTHQLKSPQSGASWIQNVCFAPDSSELIFSAAEGNVPAQVQRWTIAASSLKQLHSNGPFPGAMVLSPDGRQLAMGCRTRITIIDAHSGTELGSLKGHSDLVSGLSFSPDGRRLVSSSLDKTIRIWDPQSFQALMTLRGHASGVRQVEFSPDGWQLASSDDNGTIKFWDAFPTAGR